MTDTTTAASEPGQQLDLVSTEELGHGLGVTVDTGDGQVHAESVIAALEKARVFMVYKTEDGRFEFCEMCDRWFGAALTREQVLRLADELHALAVA